MVGRELKADFVIKWGFKKSDGIKQDKTSYKGGLNFCLQTSLYHIQKRLRVGQARLKSL